VRRTDGLGFGRTGQVQKIARSRADVLRDELDRIVRTMFVLYTLLIVGGIVFFVAVGLTQQ
jgi:hypothetical protein